MEPDHDRQKQLFEAALLQPAAGRQPWLRQVCGDDAGLFAAVWELVQAHEAAGSFLATPETLLHRQIGDPAPVPSEQAGQLVGGYKLLEQLGEGGFGTVWMAQQEQPVRRLVALKVLKAGMDSAQVVARFEQERQALAVMQHPHVAQVFDAGTTAAGRPFFVMELVKGVPITDYCSRERLSVPARLALFVQVCRAVQHAHGKGLIHRDIKPRNVLVATHDGKPMAKVIDFGIAKATGARLTDKTLFTAHRAMVGTLEYMSPEQAEGLLDIDTRADVYSLGALLYELLTGGTPFDSRELLEVGLGEVLRVLREVEPQRPSLRVSSQVGAGWAGGVGRAVAVTGEARSLFGVLRGDLDWVVMKALEKDRGRRYASADGLAEDVERYLTGDPVLAVPPSLGYRLRKFVRRHRPVVWAAGVVVVAVGVGSGVAVLSWGQQQEALARAQVARDGEQFARYANAVRAGVENAEVGNRERALGLLDGCEPRLREWEWRYSRSVAEDAVRLASDRCVAWGTDPEQAKVILGELVVTRDGEKFRGVDRLRRVDIRTGQSEVLWQGDMMESGSTAPTSTFLGQQLFLAGNGQAVAEVPQSRQFDDQSTRGRSRIGSFDLTQRRWLYRETLVEGSLVATDAKQNRMVTCSPDAVVACRDLASGEVVWRVETAASKPSDLLIGTEGDMVVMLAHSDAARCYGLRLSDGERVWTQDLPSGDTERGESTDPTRLLVTPVAHLVGAFGPDPYSDWWTMHLVDSRNGGITMGIRHPLGMYQSMRMGATMAFRMMRQMPDHAQAAASLAWRWEMIADDVREVSFAVAPDSGLMLLGEMLGQPALFVGSSVGGDFFGPGVAGSALYAGGMSDVCLQTLEWRTQPRQFSGFDRSRIGGGLTAIREGRHLLVLADRPHDVFPPRPLGIECPVASLGLWTGKPAAIYPGGITTLDCDAAARIPVEGSPYPIDVATSDASGAHLVVVSGATLRLLTTTDGTDVGPAIPLPGKGLAAALAPDARHVAVVVETPDGAHALHTFAIDSGAPIANLPLSFPAHATTSLTLAAADDRIAFAVGRAPLQLFALPTLQELPLPATAAHPASALQFAPNGELLAVGRLDGRVDILRRDGSVAAKMAAHVETVAALAWSANGTRLFTAGLDGFVRLWEPLRGVELLNLGDNSIPGQPGIRAFDGLPRCLFATPDGERLFCGYSDGAVRVWDTVPWLERVARQQPAENPVRTPK